jgi:hypothetical protein
MFLYCYACASIYQMQRYGLQPTGHHQQNIAALQEKYDEEFQKSQAGRNEYLEKRRKLDAARRKRAMYEAQHVEEMEALARNPKLEVWYNLAQDNQTPPNACLRDLNHVTCRAVARVLQQNTSLLSLDVSRNQLGDEAGVHLAEMLRTNRRMFKLEAEQNNFGPATCRAFGEALNVNNTLTFLSLEGNPMSFSDESDGRENDFTGIEAVSDMLEANTSLTSLNLFNCTLLLEGGRALAKGIQKNSSLIVLDVGNNSVGVKQLEMITDKLVQNKEQRELSDRIRREQRKESQRVAEERRKQHEAERKAREEEEWHHEQARLREVARQKEKEDARAAVIDAERKRKEEAEERARKAAEEAAKAAEKKKKKGKKKKT